MGSEEDKKELEEAIKIIESGSEDGAYNSSNPYIERMNETLKFIERQKTGSRDEFVKYYKECLKMRLNISQWN